MKTRPAIHSWFLFGMISLRAWTWAGAADSPRIVSVWPLGLFETRVAFDSPFSESATRALVGKAIAYDTSQPSKHSRQEPAKSADLADSKGTLRIAAARLEDSGRTLVLTTDPHPRSATYTFALGSDSVAYDLSGVEVVIDDGAENPASLWTGWWPVLDPVESRKLLEGSFDHEKGFKFLTRKSRLNLTTLLTLPKGSTVLRIVSDAAIKATLNGEDPIGNDAAAKSEEGRATFQFDSTTEPVLLTITLPTGLTGKPLPFIKAEFIVGPHKELKKIGENRLTVPWAPPSTPPGPTLENVPELKGGDPKRGAIVFAAAETKCAHCHKVRGQGGEVGPDLSGLVGRDPAAVYLDIFTPSARVHPDYVSYTIALKDGRVLVGTVRAEGASTLRVVDTEAKTTILPRHEIEDIRPSATSIMPVGLVGAIGEARLRDLIAFLTTNTPPVPSSAK